MAHATASGPLALAHATALVGAGWADGPPQKVGSDKGGLSVEGVLSLLEQLPSGSKSSLPERMLPWTTILMQPAWGAAASPVWKGVRPDSDDSAADRLAHAIGLVVLASDCAARVATGAVTEVADVVEQLCACRLRRFSELAANGRL